MPPHGKQVLSDTCNLCNLEVTHLKRHVLKTHLPWYIIPAYACIDCQISEGSGNLFQYFHKRHRGIAGDKYMQAWVLSMNGLLWTITHSLGLGSLEELLKFATELEGAPRNFKFATEELLMLKEYDRRTGLEPLLDSQYGEFPPVRAIILSNYLFLAKLVEKLEIKTRKTLLTDCTYSNVDNSCPPIDHPTLEIGFIDSHFHMDRVEFKFNSFTSRSGLRASDVPSPVHLAYAIANYVYPTSWDGCVAHERDSRLKFTLGLHPNMVTRANYEFYLQEIEHMLQQYPQAVGVGEIGYDLTSTCKHSHHRNKGKCVREQRRAQLLFLRQGVRLAKRTNKVLILHVRETGNGKAAPKVLNILKKEGMKNHPIHRHCFTGDEQEFCTWEKHLSNCYFSISPKSVKVPSTVAWLSKLEKKDHLILETDAPYLQKPNPWCVYQVAEETARHLKISTQSLIRICNKNAAKLYNLHW